MRIFIADCSCVKCVNVAVQVVPFFFTKIMILMGLQTVETEESANETQKIAMRLSSLFALEPWGSFIKDYWVYSLIHIYIYDNNKKNENLVENSISLKDVLLSSL